jgi:vitamin B12 transporter
MVRRAAIALLLMPALWAGAQENPFFRVQEVIVVTGERPTAQQLATTEWTVDRQELEDLGVTRLDEALSMVPGLYVRTGGEGSPRVDIRGWKGRHVRFLVNGVPASSSYDGQFNPALVPVELIDQVQVTLGPGSLLYGPGGTGGVVNVITRQGINLPGTSGVVGGGNDGRWLAAANVAGVGNRLDYSISYDGQASDGFPLSGDFEPAPNEDSGRRDNSDRTQHTVYGGLGWQIGVQTRLGLTIDVLTGEWGKPARTGVTPGAKVNFERVDDAEQGGAQLSLVHRWSDRHGLRGFLYRNQRDQLENQYADASYDTLRQQQDSRSINQGINLQWVVSGRGYQVTTALMVDNQQWQADTTKYSGGGGSGGSGGAKGTPSLSRLDASQNISSLVLEYQWQPAGQYGLTASGSWHRTDNDVEDDFSALVSGFHLLGTDTRLYGSLARTARYPTLRNLYDGSSANPNLSPEVSAQIELGLEHAFGRGNSLTAAVYESDVDNYIEKDVDDIFLNYAHYRFRGLDLITRIRSVHRLDMDFSYSYLDAENRGEDDQSRTRLQNRPEHQLKASLTGRLPWRIAARLDAGYVAGQVYYTRDGQQDLDDFLLLDLSVSQPLGWGGLSWQATVSNLLDEDHVQSEDLPQAGRQWLLSLRASL